jgi:hypothetical protein
MEQNEPKMDLSEEAEQLTETPVFTRFKEWWRAKKESLDLGGIEKYLGCDNRAFKDALTSYKNLLSEIEMEYNARIKDLGITPEKEAEARRHRDQMFLDAKRDFVYRLPENYRIWFKKRRVFNSWRRAPESWGFQESRYWGSRSGLTLRERRVLIGSVMLAVIVVSVVVIRALMYEPSPVIDRPIVYQRDTTLNVDSLVQAKLLEEQRAQEKKRMEKALAERKNRMINQINTGYYTTESPNIRTEVAWIMQVYAENVLRKYYSQKDLLNNVEALGTTLVLIEKKNPKVVTKKGTYGIPMQWQVNERIRLGWEDVQAGLDVYATAKGRGE